MKTTFFLVGLSLCAYCLSGCVEPKPISATVSTNSTTIAPAPFLSYDKEMVNDIDSKWEQLLKKHRYGGDRHGKVVIQFREHSDGTVSNFNTKQNDVGDFLGYLCKESILERAPFSPWPPDMGRMIGKDYREITFTFSYQ